MRWPHLLRRRRSPRGSGPYGTGGLTGGGPLPQPARFGQAREGRGGFFRSLWRSLALLTLAALAVLWLARLLLPGAERQEVPALTWQPCAEAASRERCVIDGDSIRFAGETVRLAGLDTPELAGRCEAERIAAIAARDALLGWLNAGAFTLAGAEGGRDKYGRPLRTLTRGGSSAAEVLVARGLAQPYEGGTRIDWCAPREAAESRAAHAVSRCTPAMTFPLMFR